MTKRQEQRDSTEKLKKTDIQNPDADTEKYIQRQRQRYRQR